MSVPDAGERRARALPFGRDRRLRKRADFLRTQDVGLRATTAHFVLLVSATPPTPAQGPARLGLVATRKIGNAVQRNRFKRVCRACFRLWPDFVPPGIDLVVIARNGAPALGLDAVRAEWAAVRPQLLKRVARALAGPSA